MRVIMVRIISMMVMLMMRCICLARPFFQKKDDATLSILSAQTFKERWNITLGFEKTDILNDQDIVRALAYGPYDLVIANNVHYTVQADVFKGVKKEDIIFS